MGIDPRSGAVLTTVVGGLAYLIIQQNQTVRPSA